MTSVAITMLALLMVKHFVCDFVLQNKWQITGKGIYGHPGGIAHSAIHVAATFLVLLPFSVPTGTLFAILVAEYVVHYHIDWAKEQLVRRFDWRDGARFWNAIGFDQLLHGLTYLAITAYLTR